MGFKNFLNKILNAITKTDDKVKQVFSKKRNTSLLKNKLIGIGVNPSSSTTYSTSNLHLELLKQIYLSQLEKAVLAATQIHYYPKHDNEKAVTEIGSYQDLTKQKINVKVNAELLPLPTGIIAMLDICNSSVYIFLNKN